MRKIIAGNVKFENILRSAAKKFDGGYHLAGLSSTGTAFVMRDPNGIRPSFYFANDEIVVALFWADWCPHCVSFKPTFEKVANDLAGTKTKVTNKKLRFEKIDCVALAPLAKKYGVQGYPTIKIIRGSSDMNNDMDEYTGSRDETTFSESMQTL